MAENIEPRTTSVYYESGEVIRIKRVSWMNTDDLWELLRDALSFLIECNLMAGECFRGENRTVICGFLDKIVNILPVQGSTKDNPIKLDYTQMDLDEVVRVFLTESTEQGEDGELRPEDGKTYLPSAISRLHGFDFFKLRGAAWDKIKAKIEAKTQATQAPQVTTQNTSPEPESQTSPS